MTEQGKKNLKHLEDIGMKLEKIRYPYYYIYSRGIIYNDEIDERRIVNVETMESTKTTVDFVKMNNCREDIKIIYVHYIKSYFICIDDCLIYYSTSQTNKYDVDIKKIIGINRVNSNTVILRAIMANNRGPSSRLSTEYIIDIIVNYAKDEPDVITFGNSSGLALSLVASRISKAQSVIMLNRASGRCYAEKDYTDTSVIYKYIQNCSANNFLFVNEPTSSIYINGLDINGKIQIEKDDSYYKEKDDSYYIESYYED